LARNPGKAFSEHAYMTSPGDPSGFGAVVPESLPQPATLRLSSTIDVAELDRLEPELAAAICQRLVPRLPGPFWSGVSFNALRACKWLSVAGLVTAFAMTVTGDVYFYGKRMDWPLALIYLATFTCSSVVLRLRPKIGMQWQAYWMFLANVRTRAILKKARATAPFEAEYEFKDGKAAYFRTRDGHAQLAWSRRLPAVRVRLSGQGFTLLYKKPTSKAPCAVFLHQPSTEFDALLDWLGAQPPAV
jgi:hypothetical protein